MQPVCAQGGGAFRGRPSWPGGHSYHLRLNFFWRASVGGGVEGGRSAGLEWRGVKGLEVGENGVRGLRALCAWSVFHVEHERGSAVVGRPAVWDGRWVLDAGGDLGLSVAHRFGLENWGCGAPEYRNEDWGCRLVDRCSPAARWFQKRAMRERMAPPTPSFLRVGGGPIFRCSLRTRMKIVPCRSGAGRLRLPCFRKCRRAPRPSF